VVAATRADGAWQVTLLRAPAYVNEKCTACGDCTDPCPVTVRDPRNMMAESKAIRLPHPHAWPQRFTIEREACPSDCKACLDACKFAAIDLDAEEVEEKLEVSSVVIATGWRPYPLENLPELGGGKFEDVIANVGMERLASSWGPTGGKILRPSNGEPPQKVAFVQCAGSRDVNHLDYCSDVCCLASLKQALYVKEQIPEAEVTMYYIDRRTPGRNEDLLVRMAETEGVNLVKGKVGKVESGEGGELLLKVEDAEAGRLLEATADLVVLATGMVPNTTAADLPFEPKLDEDGFALEDLSSGMLVAGVARRPQDVANSVRDATGSAAKAWMAARGNQ
jgi:quinone-modifying oxidoreductase subunit QmoA